MRVIAALLSLVGVLALTAHARADSIPTLDDILNATQLDAHSGPVPRLPNVASAAIAPGKPLVQPFRTGPGVTRIVRVAIWMAGWNEAWTPDKTLVCTLVDAEGAHAGAALARATEPWSRRHWEDAVHLLHLDAAALPNHAYRFELSAEGGDGILDGVATVGANAAVWHQVHVKRAGDRDALFAQAFSYFDLTRPQLARVRSAVARRDWGSAQRGLVAYFEGRSTFPKRPATPRSDPRPATEQELLRDADLVCQGKWRATDETVDLGPRWNHFAAWRTRGGVGLTRTGLRGCLATAYRLTGDEKYARTWDAMLRCFLADMPSPLRSGAMAPDAKDVPPTMPAGIGGGSMWASLSIGARMGHGFAYYTAFKDSPGFTLDTRFAFIVNLAEMAEVLERMKGGGNWEAQNTSALFEFGQEFPELRKARSWIERGFAGAAASCLENTTPDGPLKEATVNYHLLSLNRYLTVLEQAGKVGLKPPQAMRDRVEKMLEYVMAATMPDWQLPMWGDSNPPSDGLSLLARGARYYGRSDFQWVATKGQAGKRPSVTSVAFPNAGYFIMRTGWDPDARFAMFHNGHSSAHGHADQNSVVLTAYGEQMIIDPGIYVYGTSEARELTATRSHSTATPDGRDTVNDGGPSTFSSGRFADYYDGVSAGYSRLPQARHRRRAMLLKPETSRSILVMLDDCWDAEPHEWVTRFRLASGRTTCADRDFVWQGASSQLRISGMSGISGSRAFALAAGGWERKAQLPVFTLTTPPQSRATIGTVFWPTQGKGTGSGIPWNRATSAPGDAQQIAVLDDSVSYIIYFAAASGPDGLRPTLRGDCEAAAAAIDGEPTGTTDPRTLRTFVMVGGTSLGYGSTPLVSCETETAHLEATRQRDRLDVTVRAPGRALRVNPLGARWITVNCGPRRRVPPGAAMVDLPLL
jgi:hypothetical protein